MESNHVIERIRRFNQGRDQLLLKLKYQAMRADVFAFFRGSCHLFYEDWPKSTALNDTPPVWSCGDLHLENFGSFKGDNRLVYFDLDDFDESILAPCLWEVSRMVTSIFVGFSDLPIYKRETLAMAKRFIHHYAATLASGKAVSIDPR